jgi:hypothetical protein
MLLKIFGGFLPGVSFWCIHQKLTPGNNPKNAKQNVVYCMTFILLQNDERLSVVDDKIIFL